MILFIIINCIYCINNYRLTSEKMFITRRIQFWGVENVENKSIIYFHPEYHCYLLHAL